MPPSPPPVVILWCWVPSINRGRTTRTRKHTQHGEGYCGDIQRGEVKLKWKENNYTLIIRVEEYQETGHKSTVKDQLWKMRQIKKIKRWMAWNIAVAKEAESVAKEMLQQPKRKEKLKRPKCCSSQRAGSVAKRILQWPEKGPIGPTKAVPVVPKKRSQWIQKPRDGYQKTTLQERKTSQ